MDLDPFYEKLLLLVQQQIHDIERAKSLQYLKLEKKYNALVEVHNQTVNELKQEITLLRRQLAPERGNTSSPILDDRFEKKETVSSVVLPTSKPRLDSSIKFEICKQDNSKIKLSRSRSNSASPEKLGSPRFTGSGADPMKLVDVDLDDNFPNKRLKFNSFHGTVTNKHKISVKSKSFVEVPFDKLSTQYSDSESMQLSPIKISPRKPNNFNSSPEKLGNINIQLKLSPKSSPIKVTKSSPNKFGYSSIPFHKLPTQYSDDSSQAREEEIVQDSQDEQDNILVPQTPFQSQASVLSIPDPKLHTTLQNREFIRKFITSKFYENPGIKIDLKTNPINQGPWIITDFKINPAFVMQPKTKYVKVGDVQIKRRIGLTKNQEDNINKFYRLAGAEKDELQESDSDYGFEDEISQIYDKFASPPGFMQSEFPNTQELKARREAIEARQLRRIKRRIQSCLQVKLGNQTGEFIFVNDIYNLYVKLQRYTI